ncbi:MAG: hypothetical protein SP4CHLAM5_01380 [Chlamydiia bacterium]|nr:hypothetical protein [Chlamydiia bacterium]MCH9618014.1 hypothetical protein [Chlamydiia bacterium]MCH9623661.1 hypothetical protein [Chlamydiia bacterium]
MEKEVQIKFPTFDGDSDLDIISSSLDCRIFVPEDTLQKFIFQLRSIDTSLSENTNTSLQEIVSKKRKLVERLAGRCQNLKERNSVISFAEEAEGIANSSPILSDSEIKDMASNLRARIDLFISDFKPSKNNMKFLRFAKKLLQKAEKHEPVLTPITTSSTMITFREDSCGEISLDDFSLAENLYEIAALLYEGKIENFEDILEKNFSRAMQKEMSFHVSNCGGKISLLSTPEQRLSAIRGILGYAHTITDYFASETPYPSIEEVDNTFSAQMY